MAIAAVMVVAAGFTQIWPAFAAPAVLNTDLSSYSLFAYEHLDIKGGQTGEFTGNIGVRDADPDPTSGQSSIDMCLGGSGHPVKVADGYQVVGDTMKSTDKCDFFDFFVNKINSPGAPVVRNSQQTWTPPLPMTIPDPGPFACNPANPSVVANNTTATVVPGVYGDSNWQNGSDVTLTAGVYIFCNFKVGKNATVTTEPGVDIRVLGELDISDGSTFGEACDVNVFVRGEGAKNGANHTNFGENVTFWGTLMAPNGEMALGRSTHLHGRFWGLRIHDDFDMEVDICTPDTPTTTTSTSTTTTTVLDTTTTTTSTTTTTVPDTTTTTTVPDTTTTTTVPDTTTTTTVPDTTTTTTVPETTTTTTVPETTTTVTVPDTTTTTTVPETTTSVADSTTIATTSTTTIPESTTIVTEGSTVTSSTTVPSSVTTQAVTTTTVAPVLPFTGNSSWAPMLGMAAFAFGGALLFLTRKRNPRRV